MTKFLEGLMAPVTNSTGKKKSQKPGSILASASIVAIAMLLSKSIGFLREISLAAVYGAGTVSDSFVIAYTVPGMVLMLVAGSFSASYIPIYTGMVKGKRKFTNNVLTILACMGLLFSLVFTFFPQVLTYLFASQFDAERFSLTTALLRVMVWSAIPLLFTGILEGYLQIHKAFFFAAITSIPINIFVISSMWLSKASGMLTLLSIGTVVGFFSSMSMLLFTARRKGYTYRPMLDLRMPELRGMMILIAPIILSNLISELNQVVDRNFASMLVSGSVSSLNYANKLVGTVITLISGSLGTVLFPNLSELAASNDIDTIRHYISMGVKRLLPLFLPAATGLILMAEPLVKLLFEHGSFTVEDTIRTAECLRIYAFLIITSGIGWIVVRAFFAIRNTKSPAMISVTVIAVNAGLNALLVGVWKHQGLAFATVVASLISMVLLLTVLQRKLGSFGLFSDPKEWIKTLIALAIMGGVVFLGIQLLPVMADKFAVCAVSNAGLMLMAVVSYLFVHYILRTEFFREVIRIVRKLF
jgi:putative peptidoglycan lipid II flippase